MRTFTRMAAQGDVLLERIDNLPEGVEAVTAINGRHVIAHSETGHHHVMVAERDGAAAVDVYCRLPDDIYDCFLVVHQPTDLVHERGFDTHETLQVPPGMYRVRRQREYTPQGYRRAQD